MDLPEYAAMSDSRTFEDCGCTLSVSGTGCWKFPGTSKQYWYFGANACDSDGALSVKVGAAASGAANAFTLAMALVSILIQFKN